MRITMATIGARGDIEPALALAVGLRARGHDVTFVGPAEAEAETKRAGIGHRALAPAIAELTTPDERESLLKRLRKFRIARRHIIRQFDRVLEAARDTDLLLASITFAPAALTARDRYGIPIGVFNVAVPFVRTGEHANPWLPALPFGRAANRLSYVLFEELLWQPVRGPVNRWRRTLGLPPFPFFGFFAKIYRERVLLLLGWSRHVYPKPDDYPPAVHVTGRWFLEQGESYQPPDGVEELLGGVQPPVCITFGSNPIGDKERTLRALIGALHAAGRRGILVGGASGLGQGADLQGTMIALDHIPFSWLFPRVGLVIHHGGCGVSACCLEAGVPCIVLPTRPDQLALGRRLCQLGVAPPPIPLRKLTPDKLATALRTVLEDDEMAAEARRLSVRIRQEHGIDDAVAAIDQAIGGCASRDGDTRHSAPLLTPTAEDELR